jgi:hypothetical protein
VDSINIWAQLVGAVGIISLIAIFQFNKRRTILRLQLLSGLIWTLHYILLGAYTGAGLNFLAAVRNYLFDKYRKRLFIYWLVVAAFTMITILTWKDWTSILPYVGTIIGTTAMWQKKPSHIRWMFVFVPPFWFVYNALNGSYPGMLGDTITFGSLAVGIYRFDILPMFKKKPAGGQSVRNHKTL